MDSFYTILSEEDEKINQPETIKIPLMNHQKTMVNKMINIENNNHFTMEYTLPIIFDDYELLYNPILYKYTEYISKCNTYLL
jgi:hypothetical protein